MKAEGRFKEIQKTITALKREHDLSIPKDLAYVEGALFDDYIHDMKLTQKFAILNRKAMVDVILSGMGLTPVDEFTTIHNYIDTDAMILRRVPSLHGREKSCSFPSTCGIGASSVSVREMRNGTAPLRMVPVVS